MSDAPQKVSLDLAAKGVPTKKAKTLLGSFAAPSEVSLEGFSVEPFGAWIGEITTAK